MLSLSLREDNTKKVLTMAIMTVLFGAAAACIGQLGMLLIPLISAPLAVLFVHERGKRRVLTVATPILIVAIDAVINGFYSFSCLSAVVVAVLIYVSCATGFLSKGDGAVAATIAVSLIGFLTVILFGCILIDKVDFGAAIEYYRQLVIDMRDAWVVVFEQNILAAADPSAAQVFTPEYLRAMYDDYIQALYSMLVILVFILVGLSFKLFAALMSRSLENKTELYSWRFSLSPIYSLVYIVILVLGAFGDGRSAFSVIVSNLSNVFMAMFAYVGFLLTDAYLRMKSEGRRGAILLTVLSLLLLGSVATLVLSLLGVLASFLIGRAGNGMPGGENNGQGGSDAR